MGAKHPRRTDLTPKRTIDKRLEQSIPSEVTHKQDHDIVDFDLPLEERLLLGQGPGKKVFDLPNVVGHVVDSNDLDDFLQTLCIFKRVNEIKFVNPSHCYFIIKRLGYRKNEM